ncbi:riboflavin synthase subunit alpha [Corynebacterium sp. HMSC063A05]|uniref:riboflavin synthase n=1 Tax=Corynebacterium TaxID=1716 RepID=UPI0006679242|nr:MULTISPECIES: riboflavin synthase [Corynebacterium]MCG7244895.1 riboflavin synthase [Corynebacterium sp. ACRPX]MDK8819173.1 riboflavin synthase [Corynebacterium amycolatum]MDY7342373.1 riboflavin synthase [Corynebacterium amycolatum]OFM84959.1 riboflavin synthase subunit alpha [Corynebacterium sp. HMSC063A05]OFR92972.1 riboflavin synthase subunit alpha [Corynebacterium sp. HMSC064E10]
MFTGIVEELGEIREIHREADSITLTIRATTVLDDVHHGDSIAVNGVCLTVVEFDNDFFTADLMQETLDRSSLGQVEVGSKVNLERATAVGQRLGGHIVQGHIDGTGEVISRTPGERWEVVRISLPKQLSKYVVEKGSIAVDGTSLTVSAVGEGFFEVSLIPTTLTDSVIGSTAVGTKVNLEVDVLAKYVEKMLER